jgi:hypothetical protein
MRNDVVHLCVSDFKRRKAATGFRERKHRPFLGPVDGKVVKPLRADDIHNYSPI